MHERNLYDEDQNPIGKTPVLSLKTTTVLGQVELDHENTRLRLHPDEYEHLDHVELWDGDAFKVIFLEQFEDPDVKEQLLEFRYKHSFRDDLTQADFDSYDKGFLYRHNIAPLDFGAKTREAPTNQDLLSKHVSRAVSIGIVGFAIMAAVSSRAKKFLDPNG